MKLLLFIRGFTTPLNNVYFFPAIYRLIWQLGIGCGGTFTGMLFSRFGTSTTMLSYAIFTLVVFVLFLGYIYGSNSAHDYELADQSEDEDDEKK